MTEPTPEPQINQEAIAERAAALLSATLLAVATVGDELAVHLLGQELLDAFTQGFYAGLDTQWIAMPAPPAETDK